ESANSERMGEFDFALVPGAAGGVRKYNYITYVLEVPGVTNADSLADYVGVGTVYQVMRYDPVTQSFSFPGNVWMPQFGIGNNFPLVVGQVYALQLEQSAPSIVGLVGRVPDPGSVTFSLVAGASAGDRRYNFISVPLDRPDLLNADQLADDIHPSAVYQVMQYDAQLQSYPFPANVWMPRFNIGTNFPVRIGYPYVVQLEQGAPTTWPLYQETHPTMEEER
ncbi:MAG: hypothetical protein JXA14_10075, partial [Anaerolineae bacterium]|nr:hypothetical protein [Anaerolineae bacterium]